jgi:hypothetical protein
MLACNCRAPWRPARKDPTRQGVIKDRRTPWIRDLQASASFAFRANNAGQRLLIRSLQHRGRVDHDVDGIRLNADGAHVAFREMLAADRHAWRLHIGGRSHSVFNPAQCAACSFRFAQGTGFSAVGAANWRG